MTSSDRCIFPVDSVVDSLVVVGGAGGAGGPESRESADSTGLGDMNRSDDILSVF